MAVKFVFNGLTAIITDYKSYADNVDNIDDWLQEQGCDRKGMVITFCSEQAKLMFVLRWS